MIANKPPPERSEMACSKPFQGDKWLRSFETASKRECPLEFRFHCKSKTDVNKIGRTKHKYSDRVGHVPTEISESPKQNFKSGRKI